MSPVWLRFLCLAVCFGAALARAEDRIFSVRGTVIAALADGNITVAHDEIPGYMPAMTMPFNVEPAAAASAAQLRPGDRIEFRFRVSDDSSRAFAFKRLGRAQTPPPPARASAAPAGNRRLREGDALPAFALTDQDGTPLTDATLRGSHTLLTFIFTRCPVPDFCPRLSSQFQALQRRIVANPAGLAPLRLLSVTIDPEFDTPAVLRGYGEHYGSDSAIWRFATGPAEEVDTLRRAFALRVERNAATLDHALVTALIDPELRVVTIWRGNRWTPDEVVQALRAHAPAPTGRDK